ncbi:MAG: hypothetical protein JXO44_02300 [Clostridia bacterium]|nr:hypothetical protein [Clostridia bacterium]
MILHLHLNANENTYSWYNAFMMLGASGALVGLAVMMDKKHRPMLMANEKAASSFEDALRETPMTAVALPYAIVNQDFKIVYRNDAFGKIIKSVIHKGTRIPDLATYFEMPLDCDTPLDLNERVVNTKALNDGVSKVKINCQIFGDDHHIVCFFHPQSEAVQKERRPSDHDGLIERYDRLLNVGAWELSYDTAEILCSKRTMDMFRLQHPVCKLESLKNHMHPEDLIDFERNFSKIAWISGCHTLDLRFLVDDEIKYVTVTYEMNMDDEGLPYKLTGFVQDISERSQAINERLLREQRDVVAGIVEELNHAISPLLEGLLKDEAAKHHMALIHENRYLLNTYKRKYIDAFMQKNLVNADKIIEETVSQFFYAGKEINVSLNLNAGNSLINVDEERFELLITHLIGEIPRLNNGVKVVVESHECKKEHLGRENTFYAFTIKVSKEDMPPFDYERFKERFYRIPAGSDETMLYHAHGIIKKFHGRIGFDEDDYYYMFRIEFDAIRLDLFSENRNLKKVGYIGNYFLAHRMVRDFLLHYSVELVTLRNASPVEISKYEVVISDAGIDDDLLEKFAIACRKTQFIVLNQECSLTGANIMKIDIFTSFGELVNHLSKDYLLVSRQRNTPSKVEAFDILEDIDKEGIHASTSCKNMGRQPHLYFDYLKKFSSYYGVTFAKVIRYAHEENRTEFVRALKQVRDEARLLGLISIENYAEQLIHCDGYISEHEMLAGFTQVGEPLEKAIEIIESAKRFKGESVEAFDEEVRYILVALEECVASLKQGKPLRSRELLQVLLHYQSMASFEENLVEASLLAQKYRFDEAIEAVEAVIEMIAKREIA